MIIDLLSGGREGGQSNPNRAALVSATRNYSYSDLRRESLQYSLALREAGVDIAPLLVNQSAESLFLYLGALQACRRVIPLGVNVLLRDPGRFEHLLARNGLYATRRDWDQLAHRFKNISIKTRILNPVSLGSREPMIQAPRQAELVLHTSSSTTKHTKAVLVSTDYLHLFFDWCEQSFALSEQDRFLWVAPLHFDMSFVDVLLPLHLGATLVIPARGELFYPDRFMRLLCEQRVTVLHSVPSLWHALVTRESKEAVLSPTLKTILVAGDILPRLFQSKIKSAFPSVRIFNVYGQTEANSYLCHRMDDKCEVSFPLRLGRTESYADIFVQTESGLMKDGFGELVVGGPSVAQGYLESDYETTRPLSSKYGSGHLLTGDLVRIQDGAVDLYGRIGAHIGVNGGIQHELDLRTRCNQIEGVVQSVLMYHGGRPVLVFEPESPLEIARLITTVESVVPSEVLVCAKTYFPLNYNGKIDLQQLAESLSS